MSFSDLFRHFRDEVMSLCCEAAMNEGRAYCFVDEDGQPECALCDRPQYDDGTWAFRTDNGSMRLVCDGPECRLLWGWYHRPTKEGGGRHRQTYKLHFGRTIYQTPKELRPGSVLTAILLTEAHERKSNERMAARNPARRDRAAEVR
jgi:hypothetical protein